MKISYQVALDYLYSFTDYEKKSGYVYSPDRFDLKRVDRLLALLDNPHRAFQAVHIAGTKGKGSTAAMIASILRHAGYRTALYTSPHLHTFRERIQIDGELITEQAVVAGVERLRAVAAQVPEITTFELITALAFDYFAGEKVEWAVLETGMGGRLDATNVVTPQASVLTPISYDHMMYLGDTLSKIAAEKAGIIKPGVPVISAPQPSEALQTIECIAAEKKAPLTLVGREWQYESVSTSITGQQMTAYPVHSENEKPVYKLPLLGDHQQVNATTALATIAQLRSTGAHIPERADAAGLQHVTWPGRFQVLGKHPWVIVDGAHNGDSMQKLSKTLADLFPGRDITLILGISSDKDLERMLDAILPVAKHILVTQAHHPRAAPPQDIVDCIAARGKQARIVAVEQALEQALALTGKNDLICATGSLFVVADLRVAWFKYKCRALPPSDTK